MSDVPPADSFGADPLAGLEGLGFAPGELQQFLDPQQAANMGVADDAIGGVYDPSVFGPQQAPSGAQTPNPYFDTINRPYYKNGDEWRTYITLPPEEQRRLQERLQFVGLLDEFRPNSPDSEQKVMSAMSVLLGASNRRGKVWTQMLSEFETNISSGLMDPFNEEEKANLPQAPSAEAIPDYASLQNQVMRKFKEVLRRDPTEAELRLFADGMMADSRAAATQDFKRRADTRDIPADVGASRVPLQEQIDPVARFEQAFQQRMGGQIETMEKQANTGVGAALAQEGVNAAARQTGTS